MGQRETQDDRLSGNLQQVFIEHKQQLRIAVEESARFLREAALSARQLYLHADPAEAAEADQVEPGNAEAGANLLKPLPADFVAQAQQRAQEMFDEIARTSTPSQSEVGLPPAAPMTAPDNAAPDPLAATTLLMTQATQHLTAAMDSVLQGMKGRLAAGAVNAREPAETPNKIAAAEFRFSTRAQSKSSGKESA